MNDKDKQIAELKKLVLGFGNAAADLIEQALKCDFTDDIGHPLTMSQAFIDLGNALQAANDYAASQEK